jgi:predicted DCC family thiol-disulfide oxidoreductase YuxK
LGVDHPVVLFDGVCNLCNGSVVFIIRNDPRGVLRFAPLQSEQADRLLGGRTPPRDSVVLVENGRVYTRSEAVLRIARLLRQPWPLLSGLIVLPAGVRDWLYDWIARNRYRWFGKREACMMPTPELRSRFL